MEQTQTELLAEEKTSGNEFLRVEHLKKYFVIEKSLLGKPSTTCRSRWSAARR